MNAKNLSILAILTLAVVIAAVVLTQPQTVTPDKGKFFPNLMSTINDVTAVNITAKNETITIIRGENQQWLLKERHNYPVTLEPVHKLLLGTADLTILEAKTSNPILYSKIGVEDVTKENAESTLLTLKNGEGKTVAVVIVGNDRVAKIDSTRREIYVRKPEEKQAWLTLGQLPIKTNLTDWLDKPIIDIASDDVRQVSITQPYGDSFLLLKDSPEADDYKLANLPENAKVKFPYLLKNIATTLAGLKLDDVVMPEDVNFDDQTSIRAVFTTFDGLEVTMTTMEEDSDNYYAKFSAAFNPDAIEPKKEKTTAVENKAAQVKKVDEVENTKPNVDAKELAKTINTKLSNWVYVLSKYKVENLYKSRDDLISVEEAEDTDSVSEDLPSSFGTPETADMEDFVNLPSPFGTPSTVMETLMPVPDK